ncbi:right-handed parallel beta-helix repeat-containing protein [Ensifer adhaerens]|uniref:right-handed parallel beta-helix repeat-containing protein n=1 Tax=Ensifer adhaerens TaxID=106592 RepID=UPI000CF1C462|nr:right-handed parallel beta-helix repeat-containing protein [Ensifer adhaerens]
MCDENRSEIEEASILARDRCEPLPAAATSRRRFLKGGAMSAAFFAVPWSLAASTPGSAAPIARGSGWTEHPLTESIGSAATPRATGAQPFTIDAPANPNGPVFHLADFGAIADGVEPPVDGPDRNLAALQAALDQCRKTKAAKLVVGRGIYRFTSGKSIVFDGFSDFTFDGGGATFLFHLIEGGEGISIKNCRRSVFSNFNLDWDCAIDPPAWVGRVTELADDQSNFVMSFETAAPLDPKVWVTMNPLDEELRAPGAGTEFDGFAPTKIEKLDEQTVRVWPTEPINPIVGHLYLLRHYTYEKHAVVMVGNSHLSLRNVNIYTFPGEGFVTGGDQHHFELVNCRIAPPANERRPITTTADGFHVGQSQGFIRLERCEFSFMGDDCVNIHDNFHMGVEKVGDDTLVALQITPWRCPFAAGDPVEIRYGDYSPTGFTAKLKSATPNYETSEVTLVFSEKLPAHVPSDAMLFNRRYGTRNVIIRDCYFHENRARGVLCNGADWLVENNRFFHNQYAAMLVTADASPGLWEEGFGARNLVVRGNHFQACNPMGVSDGAIVHIGADVRGAASPFPLLDDLLFEHNQFEETPGPAITATSFRNLVFQENTVINREKPLTPKPMRGGVRAELGTGLWVEGNSWTTQEDIEPPRLYYDADTVRSIACRANVLKT